MILANKGNSVILKRGENNMKVLKIKENKDGSAGVTFEFTKHEEKTLIEFAVNTLLKQYIEEKEKNDKND